MNRLQKILVAAFVFSIPSSIVLGMLGSIYPIPTPLLTAVSVLLALAFGTGLHVGDTLPKDESATGLSRRM